jgi:hypothetical protein
MDPWTADDLTHNALDITDALSTLVYLLRLDASDPALVCSYANQMEERLLALRTLALTAQSAVKTDLWPAAPQKSSLLPSA